MSVDDREAYTQKCIDESFDNRSENNWGICAKCDDDKCYLSDMQEYEGEMVCEPCYEEIFYNLFYEESL